MSKYPGNWDIVPLEKVAEIIGGGTPSRVNSDFWGNDHFWVTPSEVVALDGGFVYRSKEKISDLGLKNSSAKLLPPGTILMTSRASIGYAAIAKTSVSTNQGFQSIICGENLDHLFALHQIRYRKLELQRLAAGSTFSEISSKNVRSFSVVVPPLPEQKKIAEILCLIDQKLNAIQIKIDSLDHVYKSMLIDVLKKLSNKSTDFKLSHACNDVFLGLTSKVDYVEKDGIPLVRATNIINGNIDFVNTRQITIKQHQALTKYRQAEVGDILVTKSGSLGECAVVKEKKEFSIYESIVCLKPKKDLLSTQYLYHVMKSNSVRDQFSKDKVGSAVSHLNLNDFRQIVIPIPSLDFQVNISNALDSVSNTREKLQLKLQKINCLKLAMSSDLLSGLKRVKV
tara:strand:- start:859 stop:2049 length:1191 start_codon:yes stop_codon:yes gene_type:complete